MTLFSLSYSFNQGSAQSPINNGNVVQIQNNRDNSRTQTFAYDLLNRVASGKSQATSGANCWGENFTYDSWGNLLQRAANQTGSGCQYESLSVSADGNNRVGGWNYDGAGNLLVDNTYSYNSEDHLATAEGVTYTYDGDGQRVEKSNGKMYWRGTDGEPLEESDLSGNINEEYVFFGGHRIARTDLPSGAVHFYFSDHLGSASVIANAAGSAIEQETDYYPFGGERIIVNGPNTYKFTGKERDSETGNDYFGARHYGSTVGRWITPDPWLGSMDSANPQSLNRYAYVLNNPLSYVDPDGLDCAYLNNVGNAIEWVDHNSDFMECTGHGGYWVSGQVNNVSVNDDGSYRFGWTGVNADGTLSAGVYANYLGPNTDNSVSSAWEAVASYVGDFITGGGEANRLYDMEDIMTRSLMQSKGVQQMNQRIQQRCHDGVTSGKGGISTSQAAKNLPSDLKNSPAGAEVGAFIYKYRGQAEIVSVTVKNDTGMNSAAYHVVPNKKGSTGRGRTIHQTFQFNEPNPCVQ